MHILISMLFGSAIAASVSFPTAAFADGDAVKGSKVFKKCAACHTATEENNKIGPHLVGIVDRAVASIEGYKYSEAMIDHATEVPVWTAKALEDYLRAPRKVVKGTKMAFAGLKKDDDVENIIAYLTDPSGAE
ncbi:c-type cytochrome [Hoeflea sp.]|uniref:c-type cytochrome n=1 Tax=Hoeflea sp. TaxID=1940281 RepID=UPI003A939126